MSIEEVKEFLSEQFANSSEVAKQFILTALENGERAGRSVDETIDALFAFATANENASE